jgi:hypothetical protein
VIEVAAEPALAESGTLSRIVELLDVAAGEKDRFDPPDLGSPGRERASDHVHQPTDTNGGTTA